VLYEVDVNDNSDIVVISKGWPPKWISEIAKTNPDLLPIHIKDTLPKHPPANVPTPPKPPDPPRANLINPSGDEISPDKTYLVIKYSEFMGSVDFISPPMWFNALWNDPNHPLIAEIEGDSPPVWLGEVANLKDVKAPDYVLSLLAQVARQ